MKYIFKLALMLHLAFWLITTTNIVVNSCILTVKRTEPLCLLYVLKGTKV